MDTRPGVVWHWFYVGQDRTAILRRHGVVVIGPEFMAPPAREKSVA